MTNPKSRFLNERKADRNFKVYVEIVKYDGNEGPWPVQAMGSEYLDKAQAELIFQTCRRIVQ